MVIDRKYTALPEGVHLNPLQEMLVPHMDADCNVLVSAPTASGKTQALYMFGNKWLEQGKRVCYIGTMRALAQEKADDLDAPDHPWNKYAHTVISGDYVMNAQKEQEILDAKVICITPEALASRLRHSTAARNAWLKEVGILIIDEIHLLGQDDRGTNMEVAIVEFTRFFPRAQLVGLSATVPNMKDLQGWFEKLNNKETVLVETTYRPVPLHMHYIPYEGSGKRVDIEDRKIRLIEDIIRANPGEQFLVGVWHKGFGERITDELARDLGVSTAFHNANKTRSEKHDIEAQFKAGNIRVLVSTSTLFTGVNLPARNVIITAVEAGKREIPVFELQQAAGRAGRPRYDTEGDAYFLIPKKHLGDHVSRIEAGERVLSSLYKPQYMAMHLIGAIYVGAVWSIDSFAIWFGRTLARYQKQDWMDYDKYLQKTVNDMVDANFITVKQIHGVDTYELTKLGVICAQLYLNPYHYQSALKNMQRYVSLTRPTDYDLAYALGTCKGYASESITAMESNAMQDVVYDNTSLPYWSKKAVSVILYRIQGINNGMNGKVPYALSSMNYTIMEDLSRLQLAIVRANAEYMHWGVSQDRLDAIFMRVARKCSEAEATLAIAKFTKTERKKLNMLGFYTLDDVQNNMQQASQVLSPKRVAALQIGSQRGMMTSKPKTHGFRRGNA